MVEKKTKVDLIVMATYMSPVDGYKFLEDLNKNNINIPVICKYLISLSKNFNICQYTVMSEDKSMSSRSKAYKLGAVDYWFKPLTETKVEVMEGRKMMYAAMMERRREEAESCFSINKRLKMDNNNTN